MAASKYVAFLSNASLALLIPLLGNKKSSRQLASPGNAPGSRVPLYCFVQLSDYSLMRAMRSLTMGNNLFALNHLDDGEMHLNLGPETLFGDVLAYASALK